ncbi:MAG: hypothetical protein Q9172_004854 [Xanthocarpia lactea]
MEEYSNATLSSTTLPSRNSAAPLPQLVSFRFLLPFSTAVTPSSSSPSPSVSKPRSSPPGTPLLSAGTVHSLANPALPLSPPLYTSLPTLPI